MKNSLISISVFSLILMVFSSLAWGKAPVGVSKGVHNLSSTGGDFWRQQYTSNVDEICVFCHTPHSGSLDGPLWNRDDATPAGWSHYTTATLTSLSVSSSRAPNNESMLCLSCHDGSVGVFRVINIPNTAPTTPIQSRDGNDPSVEIAGLDGMAGARIGGAPFQGDGGGEGNLSDDHPISFSYDAVYTVYNAAGKNDLRQASDAVANGVQFFGPNNNLECSSCHDPHADTTIAEYSAFLITSNSGSKLCLACHIK